ncbi:MAG TPA: DUF4082 domain-containing protein [Solirubrobacterales bacterium]|nr:DUF4082 domain-containing protein [Solirubrobacterales bacterium]
MRNPAARRLVLRSLPVLLICLATTLVVVLEAGSGEAVAAGSEATLCAPPVTNPIACENSKKGLAPGEWQIREIGDESIQGFATAMNVNIGETENFKIKTPSPEYHVNILRLGYYEGDGARMIQEGIKPSAKLPQTQPECMHETLEGKENNTKTGLIDCGNWAVSASWKVPSTAVSGLYVAQLVRDDSSDKGGESQVFFVVTDNESTAPILLKTSDSTWEAYNAYGGNSLYSCTKFCPVGEPEGYKAAYSVSYNRPFDGTLSTDDGKSDPFYAEYQMIRFLEKQGYNISYTTQGDISEHPETLLKHKMVMTSGHDEYWSAGERSAFEAAREAKVNEAFFTGNETFWKTRWGASIDSSKTPYRTVTTYKETHFNEPVDPEEPNVSTSSWADPRFGTKGGAGKPANSLTGQYFLVNSGTADIKVPGTFAKLRFWKNTQVAKLGASETLTLSPGTGTLGYEWDIDADNGFRPPGRIPLSSTTVNGLETFVDYGTHVVENGVATHSLSLYRAPSGALVFGAGTVQWSWGLDNTNAWDGGSTDPSGNAPDPNMEQATVNLLGEMGAQPSTLQTGLTTASETTDHTAPTATITSPTEGQKLKSGEAVTVKGTAADTGGGVVAAVEVSTDGGQTWHPASGTTSWTYSWNVDGDTSATIKARAIDDSANIGAATAGTNVVINCPCSMLGSRTPAVADAGDSGSIELGVKFRSDVAGAISGVRYFKSSANTGTHVGSLWTAGGTLLAEATFKSETTSGWQQVEFTTPVQIEANTTYVAAYFAPNGHYADTAWQLDEPPATGESMLNHGPLHILPDVGNGNGVFEYSGTSTFPEKPFHADNYWVDVLFTPKTVPPLPGTPGSVSATAGLGQATVIWSAPTTGGEPSSYKITPFIGGTAQTAVTVPAGSTSKTLTGLAGGTTYTFTVTGVNEAGAGPASSPSNAVTPTSPTVPGTPTGVSAKAAPIAANVSWTAPSSDGGSAITSYKVTPYIGGVAQTPVVAEAGATSLLVEGLTGGTSYTFTVRAVNAVGAGPESSQTGAVVPTEAKPAGAPTGVTATAKSSGAILTWTAPASDGGSEITRYRITPLLGGVAQTPTTTSSSATTGTVSGLTNDTSYTFKVQAITAAGLGAESAESNAVTPFDTIFDQATPGTVDSGDGGSVELGVRFRSDVAGEVNGIRFYKASTNTGTHIGSLWSAEGKLLAEATFKGETASGWQQVEFTTPVQIQPNTTYVAGYLAPSGHYSVNGPNLEAAVNNAPLHAEASGADGNGVFAYGSGSKFPVESYNASNYWVDVLFTPEPIPVTPGAPSGATATAGLGSGEVSWTAPSTGTKPTSYVVTPYIAGVAQTAKAKTVTGTPPATSATVSGLTAGTSYTFTVKAANSAGTGPESPASNAVTPSGASVPGAPTGVTATPGNAKAEVTWTAPSDGGSSITGYKVTPYLGGTAQTATSVSGSVTSATVSSLTNGSSYTFKVKATNAIGSGSESEASATVMPRLSLFETGTPATPNVNDSGSVVLGFKFTSSIAGKIRGVRFYKSTSNTGTHVVGLWSSAGSLLAEATPASETPSGWQEATFSSPVSISANTTYVAGYLAPKGHYSATSFGLESAVKNGTLSSVANTSSANGLFTYSGSLTLPTSSYNATNYWVDVVFTP